MKKIAIMILLFITSSGIFAQNTNVPDDKFEQALIDLGYDDTLDDYVLTANISGVTTLDVSNKEISDLTGIEAFAALTNLVVSNNKLTALDVSTNTALTSLYLYAAGTLTSLDVSKNTVLNYLNCAKNQLTSLDVSSNTALIALFCEDNLFTNLDVSKNTTLNSLTIERNQLTSLDVSKNTALTTLRCSSNKLTSLDVSNNTALIELDSHNNQLTSLDVSSNTALTGLYCYTNQLTSLDVSSNTALTSLYCGINKLTSLDVSKNTALTTLNCSYNQLTSLDVSKNTALEGLSCSDNQLTSLNMRNGVTDQLSEFNATRNSGLTCIETLDPAWATANWTSANGKIDAGVTFSVICGGTDLTTWHVATTGSDGSGSGTSASPLATIQTGVNAATENDTVLVASGTYNENITIDGKKIVLGSHILIAENSTYTDSTILDGSGLESSVITNCSPGGGEIRGFTVKNGKGTPAHDDGTSIGGGLYIKCEMDALVRDMIFEDNSVTAHGGAIRVDGDAHLIIDNSIIRNNYATEFGGAIQLYNGDITASNLLVYGNDNDSEYGIISVAGEGTTVIKNSTIVDDKKTPLLLVHGDPQGKTYNLSVSNSILNGQGDLFREWEGASVSMTYSITHIAYAGEGNIDGNPEFVKVVTTGDEESDYHLLDRSPAIGAGTATGAPTTDIEGNPRPNPAGSNPDMGAFENKNGSPLLDGTSTFNDKGTKAIIFNLELPTHSLPDTNIAIAFWKSGAENHECTGCNGRDTVRMSKISDQHWQVRAALDTILVANGETGESQYWYHYVKTIPDYKIKEDSERFKSEPNPDGLRQLESGWHKQSSLSNKDTVIAWNNIAPVNFDWVSAASDTIKISQTNVGDTYELKWSESKDVDLDTIDYLLYAQIGVYPAEEVYDTTSTSVQITYEEFLENVFELFPILPGATVRFSLLASDGKDTVKVSGDDRVLFVNRYDYLSIAAEGVPLEFALHENYPNPFNPTTTLRFDLPEVSDITLIIYNMLGQKVRTFDYENTSAGYHSVTWDATNDLGQQVGAGVYLYQLQTKNFVKTRKMVLLK